MRLGKALLAFLVSLALAPPSPGNARSEEPISQTRHGVTLFAVEPEAKRIDGVKTLPAKEALAVVRRAFDLMHDASPMFRDRVARLRKAGNVYVGYDAAVQPPSRSSNVLAVYLPYLFDPSEDRYDFIVALSRTGIHWEPEVQAALLAHELAGHAMQDKEGRMESMRLLDLECEAYLVQEQARQDLGVDKTSDESILFRQQTDGHWCDDFREWTLANATSTATEWDTLNPDIPTLLKLYPRYLKSWN